MLRYLLLALGAALLCFLLVCALRAALKKKKLPGAKAPGLSDFPEAGAFAETLSELVKLPTVSRAQGESWEDFAHYQAKIKELFPLIDKTAENRDVDGNILRLIPGTAPSRGPLLIMGHQDVVPAEGQSGWSEDPFSGSVHDGALWGRGAMDCKGTFCAEWLAVERLLSQGFRFREDLWLFSSRNEEIGGGGGEAAAEYLQSIGVRLNAVLDEGGAVVNGLIPGLKAPVAAVGLAEKGFVNLKFTAKSEGGHASTPPKNSPLVRLGAFMRAAEKKNLFPKKLDEPALGTFRAVAPYLPWYFRFTLCNLGVFKGLLARALPLFSAQAGAFAATTAAFTQASGSAAPNVLPDEAYVVCNVRPSHHQGAEKSIEALRALAKKHGVETEVLFCKEPSRRSDWESEPARLLRETVEKTMPDVIPAPYLMTGGTDSRRFEPVCDNILRFSPLRLNPQQLAAMHAANENLGVAALAEAVDVYEAFLRRYQED